MLEKILDLSNLKGDYSKLKSSLKNGKNCSVFGMGQTERLLSSLLATGKALFVTADNLNARKIYDEFKEILPNETALFLGTDNLIYRTAESNEANKERIKTLFGLVSKKTRVVVASAEALLSFVPKVERFKCGIINFKSNGLYEVDALMRKFSELGYKREALVSSPGQFSIRGDIVDIFPINSDIPYRIELFDNLVETMKSFDPETQKSNSSVHEFSVCPYTDFFINDDEKQKLIMSLRKLQTKEFSSRDEAERFVDLSETIIEKLEANEKSFQMDFLYPLIRESLSSILDYLDEDFIVVFDESKRIFDGINGYLEEMASRRKMVEGSGSSLPVKEAGHLKKTELFEALAHRVKLAHLKITSSNNLFKSDAVFSFKSAPLIKYAHNLNEFVNDINGWITDGLRVVICSGDIEGAKKIQRYFEKNDIYIDISKSYSLEDNHSVILPYALGSGFIINSCKLVVVGTSDIFPKKNQSKILKKNVFTVPKVGDYVVHSVHGIGLCEGVTKLEGSFGIKDFIVIKYRNDDKLYVPIDQMDLLDKYSGGGEPKRLSKIGGAEFGAVKEKARKAIREMAFSLVKLYAERESRKGVKYLPDDDLQLDFENSFPYTETEDQLNAILDIKKDMQAGKVMDRLICGDVGFGKTEVALRAIFKTILGGKQVAFLAPTTILSEQHYNTCLSRLSEFGVKVEVLNRFKTPKEVKDILNRLKDHKIDVLCGTHRLFSDDVVFEDLGLIVFDEEQKFGVEDKERFKLKYKDVNYLTLSATPIPRTLHMSLSGIRDISVIETPPRDRIPVATYVTEYSDSIIKDAVTKELNRGGQAFILFNSVEKIYEFEARVKRILPDARIVVGHGQLSPRELEDVVYKFYKKMADVLICTTIIENGIDIPNANTLIVIDSDKLGLSQLYQIRGRVGRGSRTGYAYFTYKKNKVLTEEGFKRLEAIAEFTEFGSGFKVAMKDLEIRGSGNIFGAEQHGHIEKIGYDLYCKMIKSSLDEIQGKGVKEECLTEVKINLDAHIPTSYIADSESRMTAYKRIASLSTLVDLEKLEQELEDTYGEIPLELKNLIEIGLIKNLANSLGVTEIYMGIKEMKLTFDQNSKFIKSEAMTKVLNKFAGVVVLNVTTLPIIRFVNLKRNPLENFKLLKSFIIQTYEIAKSN